MATNEQVAAIQAAHTARVYATSAIGGSAGHEVIGTLLTALDEAKTREVAFLSRIALLRNHLVDQRKWGYMATHGVTEYQAAQMAVKWLRTQGLEEEEAHG